MSNSEILIEGQEVNKITSHHWRNAEEVPAGGYAHGCGFSIVWQNGATQEIQATEIDPDTDFQNVSLEKLIDNIAVQNGAQVETVLQACIDRLKFFQDSAYENQYNTDAIKSIEAAIASLEARTADRIERGVEVTHQV